MANAINDEILLGVRDLISWITQFKVGDEQFKSLEKSVLTTLKKSDTMDFQNAREIRRSVWSMADKFRFHGFPKHAEYLKLSHDKYVDERMPPGDLTARLNVIRLLLSMSQQPTTQFWEQPEKFEFINKRSEGEVVEDWGAYLNEGIERWSPDKEHSFQEQSDSESDTCDEHSAEQSPNRVVISESRKFDVYDLAASRRKLEQSVQNGWFTGKVSYSRPSSDWFDANVGVLWEEHLARQTRGLVEIEPVTVISEYKVIREVLWQMWTIHSSTIFELSNNKLVAKPNVTISSVCAMTFENFLDVFLDYIESLETFRQLYQSVENEGLCETYKCYAMGVRAIIKPIYAQLVEIEIQVREQNDTFTLLKLAKRLEQIFAPVQVLKTLHQEVTGFCNLTNVECALELITRLRRGLQFSVNKMEQDIRLSLYLNCLFYYLAMVNAWLVKDDLFDHSQEFVILNKNDRNTKDCDSYEMNYALKPEVHGYCASDGIVRLICDQVLQIGRNIHLLRLLGKYDVFVKSSETVYDEFLRRILSELAAYYGEEIADERRSVNTRKFITNFDLNQMGDWTDFVDTSHGFLMKAFEDFYTEKPKPPNIPTLFQKISGVTQNLFPLQDLPERVFIGILKERFTISGLMVKTLLVEKYGLERKFKFLNHVFLFWDDLIFPFYRRLFEKMNLVNNNWGDRVRLTSHLHDILMDMYPDFYEDCTAEVEDYWRQCRDSVQACALVSLEYEIQWPLSIIVTKTHMKMCKDSFQIILLLKWALYTTNHLAFSDLEPKTANVTMKRLKYLRFSLINLLNTVQHYLFGFVFAKHRIQFELDFEKSNDLISLITAHDDFFKHVHGAVMEIGDTECDAHGFNTLLKCVKMLKVMWNQTQYATPKNLDECHNMFKMSYDVIDAIVNPLFVFD